MLPCIEDEKIILYSLGDPYRYLDLMALYNEVNHFRGKDNRFYRVIEKSEISKDINHFSTIRLEEKAFREFERLTGQCEATEYIDADLNVGYKLYPYRKKPTIVKYDILYPAITEICYKWDMDRRKKDRDYFSNSIDLSKLIGGLDKYEELCNVVKSMSVSEKRSFFYKNYEEFAIFNYEFYPYMDFKIEKILDLKKLIETHRLIADLGIEIGGFDGVNECVDASYNNTRMFKLMSEKHRG